MTDTGVEGWGVAGGGIGPTAWLEYTGAKRIHVLTDRRGPSWAVKWKNGSQNKTYTHSKTCSLGINSTWGIRGLSSLCAFLQLTGNTTWGKSDETGKFWQSLTFVYVWTEIECLEWQEEQVCLEQPTRTTRVWQLLRDMSPVQRVFTPHLTDCNICRTLILFFICFFPPISLHFY